MHEELNPARRARFLREMGVGPLWTLRAHGAAPAQSDRAEPDMAAHAGAPSQAARATPGMSAHAGAPVQGDHAVPGTAAHAATPAQRDRAAPAIAANAGAPAQSDRAAPGMTAYAGAPAQPERAARPHNAAVAGPTAHADIGALDWPGLRAAIAACTACELCRARGSAVAGDGDDRGEWLVVGLAPDGDDAAAGTPYAGERGVLLDNMLGAAGSTRIRGAYVTTAVKCRPLDADGRDRAPTDAERAACQPFLRRETELLRPRVVLALGGSHPLEGRSVPAGAVERLGDAALIALPDPQALLAAPTAKALAWNALCLARKHDGGAG